MLITNISRTSFHDGPGIRTVVYFNGCKMNCLWCHNPETVSTDAEILYNEAKCIKCGRCVSLCNNHIVKENSMVFLREGCKKCFKCAYSCPSNALSVCGEEYSPESLFREIEKDRAYFNQSGGGVTFSGGECLLYPQFLKEVLIKCRESKISTLIETALFVPYENIKAVLPFTEHFYCDLKLPEEESHKKYTGVSNRIIIENLKRLSNEHGSVTVRIPLIPNVNDSLEDMKAFGKIINTLGDIKAVELLAYNYLAKGKYTSLGKEYVSFGESSQSKEKLSLLKEALEKEIKPTVYFK